MIKRIKQGSLQLGDRIRLTARGKIMNEASTGRGPFRPGGYDRACRAFALMLRGDAGGCWDALQGLDTTELHAYMRACEMSGRQASDVHEMIIERAAAEATSA